MPGSPGIEEHSAGDLASLFAIVTDHARRKGAHPLWYRGVTSERYSLVPKIFRRPKPEAELDIFHRFRTQGGFRHPSLPAYGEHGKWLQLMQHFGAPTRLLDWSRSALVATYFALDGCQPEHSPAIWILNPYALNFQAIHDRVTPSIESGSCAPFLKPAWKSGARAPTGFLAAMSSEIDLRMFVQQSAFTIHPGPLPLEESPQADGLLCKVTIPAASVRQMRSELELIGVCRGTIFPDLENLSRELAQRWSM